MYTYEERMKAIQLYIQSNMSVATVIRELGYPSRQMLYLWYKEYRENGDLRDDDGRGYSKYTDKQRKYAVAYYIENGKSITRTIKALGYPKRTTLRDWITEDLPDDEKRCITNNALVRCTQEQKEQAVIRLCSGEGTAREIASELGTTESSLYTWKRRLLSERCDATVSKYKSGRKKETDASLESIDDLLAEKETLLQRVDELKADIYRLQMKRAILEKADEILKKDRGISLSALTNREKAVLIDALRDNYRLKELLGELDIAKSSYCYQRRALQKPEKYTKLRAKVKAAFIKARSCYGYRRIHAIVQKDGICVSEKVIRRIMREENLTVPSVTKRKYNSYVGEISPEVENIINRDFKASEPNSKWLTDITEFSISGGKVYLSPIVDCFDGMAVAWTIGTSPNAELVNSMLDSAVSLLGNEEKPIIHSDRGGHYRWPGWIARMEDAGLTRSMSKKGCSPDNSACEGFFGRVKNEMFYGRSWIGVSIDDFISHLDSYLRWYNEERIKMSLGAMSPLQYRQSLGLI